MSPPHDFPNDADGDALRSVVANGSDLSKPMYVNFQVAMPDEASANALARAAWKLGYRVSVYDDDEGGLRWTCECSTRMLASYEALLAIQAELAALSVEFGGHPDGWGTFGNGPNGQHPAI